MPQEQWRDIPSYEGFYQASNLGMIRSVDRTVRSKGDGVQHLKGKPMRTNTFNKYGYASVALRRDGFSTTFLVHSLVALTWIGPRPHGKQVRHGRNGRLDNSVGNLCYGTPTENSVDRVRDGTMLVKPVRRSDGMEFPSVAAAGRESACDPSNIAACCRGDRYKTVGGYGWNFI